MWALLVVLAVRKCNRRVASLKAAKRDVTREIRADTLDDAQSDWQAPARDPTPDEQMALAELVAQLVDRLDDERRMVLELRLQGNTVSEISEQIGRAERTVHRYLANLRDRAAELDLEASLE